VSASSFAFDPDEIEVTVGEDVAIVLTSTDILHDFTIDELDAHVAAAAGETATGGLRADEPGGYTFYCTVRGHRSAGMEGTLVVEE
jgi:cytochrome c oxidase subunit II